MITSSSIGSIYDYPSSVTVFRRTQTQLAVSLENKCLILCPHEWNHGGALFPFPAAGEHGLQLLLSAPTESEAVASFGELLAWASRRPSSKVTRHLFDPECEAPAAITTRTRHSPQRVYGYPFDRCLIREALQTFVESDCPSNQRLELRIAPVGEGHILQVDGHQITAIVMSLRPEGLCGDDPMPVQFTKTSAGKAAS